MDEKENKINEKTKENKASRRTHILFHKGQTQVKETYSRMKQNQSTTIETMWE